jgi:hypothetical protein
MIEGKTAKHINPARRERLNKGWPIKVYTYDCWPQEKPPQALLDTAHEMRRLWNEFTAIFRQILADDKKDEAGKPLLSERNLDDVILYADLKCDAHISRLVQLYAHVGEGNLFEALGFDRDLVITGQQVLEFVFTGSRALRGYGVVSLLIQNCYFCARHDRAGRIFYKTAHVPGGLLRNGWR